MKQQKMPDFMLMYNQYRELKPGPKAELRRVATPEDLVEVAVFYRLLQGNKGHPGMKRLVYCLPTIAGHKEAISLGHALAKVDISEKRLFMVVRSEYPNDLIQLRRLLKMAEPTLDWPKAATQIYWWNKLAKQKILEDYFFYHNNPGVA